jgi:hypothetical protein
MKRNQSLDDTANRRWGTAVAAALVAVAVLAGCSTGNLGTFSETTFFDPGQSTNIRELGPVQGESCQTMVLYVFPHDAPPSTQDAMQKALSQNNGTVFLANVSVERRQHWHIGYSRVCTLVMGTAYAAEGSAE